MRRTNKKINEEEEEACVYLIVSTKISSNLGTIHFSKFHINEFCELL